MNSLYSGIFWASKQPLHYNNYACALGRSGRRCFWDTHKQWNKLILGSESEADLSVDCSSKAPPPFPGATWNWTAPGKMIVALGLGEDAQAGWPRSCLTGHLEHLVGVLFSDLRQPSNSRGLITLRSTDLLKDVAAWRKASQEPETGFLDGTICLLFCYVWQICKHLCLNAFEVKAPQHSKSMLGFG